MSMRFSDPLSVYLHFPVASKRAPVSVPVQSVNDKPKKAETQIPKVISNLIFDYVTDDEFAQWTTLSDEELKVLFPNSVCGYDEIKEYLKKRTKESMVAALKAVPSADSKYADLLLGMVDNEEQFKLLLEICYWAQQLKLIASDPEKSFYFSYFNQMNRCCMSELQGPRHRLRALHSGRLVWPESKGSTYISQNPQYRIALKYYTSLLQKLPSEIVRRFFTFDECNLVVWDHAAAAITGMVFGVLGFGLVAMCFPVNVIGSVLFWMYRTIIAAAHGQLTGKQFFKNLGFALGSTIINCLLYAGSIFYFPLKGAFVGWKTRNPIFIVIEAVTIGLEERRYQSWSMYKESLLATASMWKNYQNIYLWAKDAKRPALGFLSESKSPVRVNGLEVGIERR